MRSLTYFLLMIISIHALAKSKKSTEQLLTEIQQAKHDTIKAHNYYQLAKNYLRISEDSCKMFGKLALDLALNLNNQKLQSEVYSILGAREKFNGRYEQAVQYHLKSLSIKEKLADIQGISISTNDLGIVYKNMERPKEAIEYYRKSNKYAYQCGDIRAVSMTFSNIGTVHSMQKIYDSAKVYYDTALVIAYQINDTNCIVNALSNLGEYYGTIGNNKKSTEYFEKCLVIDRASSDKYGLVLDLLNLANLYNGNRNIDKALAYMNEAEGIALKENLNKELISVYAGKHGILESIQRYPESILYLKKSQHLKDSLLNEKTNNQVSELNTKYETIKKEQTIAEQKNKITKQRALILGSLMLLAFGGMLGYNRFQKLKAEEAMKLKEVVLEQQMIATKVVLEAEEKERQRIAIELHDGVGQLMTAAKMNLTALEHEFVSNEDNRLAYYKIMDLVSESANEVREVAHNLMPNVLLKKGLSNAVQEFLNKIDNRVIKVNLHAEGIHQVIETNIEAVLYRVIQECVNNVIKHSKATQLDININNDEDGIAIVIEDNGIGFNTSQQNNTGIGLVNMKSRIEYLKGSVEIDSAPGRGTAVVIHVPNS